MDDRLVKIIDSAAVDGAQEVYANYEEYINACDKAKAEYEAKLKELQGEYCQTLEELQGEYCQAIELYDLVESVKNSIINKLSSPKE